MATKRLPVHVEGCEEGRRMGSLRPTPAEDAALIMSTKDIV